MGLGIGSIINRVVGAKQPVNNIVSLVDDAVNTGKKLVRLKPKNKAAEKMGLANYGRSQANYKWGYRKDIYKTSIEGEMSRESRTVFNYRNQVLGLPEGQVTTKSGKTYTRTMGDTGERIYTDTNGNRIVFNEHSYQLNWQPESSYIYRTTPNGSEYSIRVTNRGDEQEVVRYMKKAVGEPMQTDRIKINNQGNVLEHQIDYYSGNASKDNIYRSKTIFGCSQNQDYMDYAGYHVRRTTQAPPLWISIKNYLLG